MRDLEKVLTSIVAMFLLYRDHNNQTDRVIPNGHPDNIIRAYKFAESELTRLLQIKDLSELDTLQETDCELAYAVFREANAQLDKKDLSEADRIFERELLIKKSNLMAYLTRLTDGFRSTPNGKKRLSHFAYFQNEVRFLFYLLHKKEPFTESEFAYSKEQIGRLLKNWRTLVDVRDKTTIKAYYSLCPQDKAGEIKPDLERVFTDDYAVVAYFKQSPVPPGPFDSGDAGRLSVSGLFMQRVLLWHLDIESIAPDQDLEAYANRLCTLRQTELLYQQNFAKTHRRLGAEEVQPQIDELTRRLTGTTTANSELQQLLDKKLHQIGIQQDALTKKDDELAEADKALGELEGVTAKYTETCITLAKLSAEFEEKVRCLDQTARTLELLRVNYSELEDRLARTQEQIAALERSNHSLTTESDRLNRNTVNLQQQIQSLEAQIIRDAAKISQLQNNPPLRALSLLGPFCLRQGLSPGVLPRLGIFGIQEAAAGAPSAADASALAAGTPAPETNPP